ncbi:predicted protein [Methanosarcina acetivorans C2A]|uniref:Uncharacterized protein n=1 Tax=Methanosarcina acetivorans (strain ATCC 35395 / DSM 2834 / JCM 12185 / C2A) TaxID=188937 RepID=Q8TTR8_METAC|nr:predicted protein [Methanosarcina acetivorans C2A]
MKSKQDVKNRQCMKFVGLARDMDMKSTLTEILFLSEKRKDVLLFLADGPKSAEDIKGAFIGHRLRNFLA